MAHFAKLDSDNRVLEVIFIDNSVLMDANGVEHEGRGISFCRSMTGHSNWLQTSMFTVDGVHYDPTTMTPSGKPGFRKNFATVGSYYIPSKNEFSTKPPALWFELAEDGTWVCPPDIGTKTGKPFTHDELTYIGHLINTNTIYALAAVQPANGDPLTDTCTSTEYGLADITEITHGENTHEWFYWTNGHWDIEWLDQFWIEIDATPVAVISAFSMKSDHEKSNQIAKFCFEQHPQNETFSLHECFRSIIEWAFAFTDLGNAEPMAKLAHDFLRVVQMPLEVRNELLASVPPQVVSLFLSGEDIYQPFYRTSQIPEPELFAAWIQELKNRFPARATGDALNVNILNIPSDYPR